jgi:hypothetical protein
MPKKVKCSVAIKKKIIYSGKLDQIYSGNSGKVAVHILKKYIRINIGPMTSTAEQSIKHTKKYLFGVLNYNFFQPK